MLLGEILFLAAMSLLWTHELDAVRCHEWRLFPGLNRLHDASACTIFVSAHVPLFIVLAWLLMHPNAGVHFWFRSSMDAFLIVHWAMHRAMRTHPRYEFTSRLSNVLIGGAALAGAAHLALLLTDRAA